MPAYLFYPRRANGVSLTFIAETATDDVAAMELAADIAAVHECVGVFVWEPAIGAGPDRFVGEVNRADAGETWVEVSGRGAVASA
ncbi:hypothetical protein [Caulobacter sp.]|uniref:hypothetical protein n=1 Tax=Caulobacter sp. TaxID=78 RepID=UPI002B4A9CC3|nr:hypothetical protein [Caulobacter sp.]HJV43099.1 hypothetical protein [Caulobacter sp.]